MTVTREVGASLDARVPDDKALQPWRVDVAQFPPGAAISEEIEFCVRYAVLAPSTHNTQPWWFQVDGPQVTIGMDPGRTLAIVDPTNRESLMSVGAAGLFLRVALARFGLSAAVSYWPDPRDPDACVRMTVSRQGVVDDRLVALFDAIPERRTAHGAFRADVVAPALLTRLADEAGLESATFTPYADYPTRHRLAELVSEADHRQMADRRFRRELASWLRGPFSGRPDGIYGYGSGSGVLGVAAPFVVRTFDIGDGRAAHDVELATGSPVLAVLSTGRDGATSWLRAGAALGRVLLRATAENVRVGFLDQPIEVAGLREDLARVAGIKGYPQVLLRLGYGGDDRPQPRRAVTEVLR